MAKKTNRGLARLYLEGFIKQGLGANATLRALREMGLGYRRSEFLRDYRLAKGIFEKKPAWKHIPKEKHPSENLFEYRPFRHGKKYTYIVQIEGQNIATGRYETGHATIISNRILTPSELEAMAPIAVGKSGSDRYENISEVLPIAGYINSNVPY